MGDPIAISVLNGIGLGDILDEVVEHFPEGIKIQNKNEDIIRVAMTR
ncbi:MAG: hypothetical protein ACLTDP_01765 [Terrisporobacter sp.]